MSYDPARHTALHGGPWSADAASDAITAIARDFENAVQADGLWPTHPLDEADRAPRRCAYTGAAGAITALAVLRRHGVAAPDWRDRLPGLHEALVAEPDFGRPEAGLQLGEVGVLAPAVLADPAEPTRADRLADAMDRLVEHPAREITSGATGALAAARVLADETGQARWREHTARLADALHASWERHRDTGSWLWRHEIFGGMRRYFGACHGVAGNAGELARASELLGDGRAPRTLERAAAALEAGAIGRDTDLNWPVSPDPSGGRRLVQWCHGAPGVVTALAIAPGADAETTKRLDALLLAAGHTVWTAGPVRKGPGVCHGTAGNGYAFLFLHRRTGDALWLERARAFAMHAIAQRARHRERFGQGRFTLWTGDGGLAVYLLHCLRPEQAAIPGLGVF